MNKMGKSFMKGKKRSRVIALAVLLAVLIAGIAAVTATAATSSFVINTPADAVQDNSGKIWSWAELEDTGKEVTLDTLFDVTNTNAVRMVQVQVTNCVKSGTSSNTAATTISVNRSGNTKYGDPKKSGTTMTTSYSSTGGLSLDDIETYLRNITLKFNTGSGRTNGSSKITITAYSGTSTYTSKVGSSYVCELKYFRFAKPTLVPNTLKVGYQSTDNPDGDRLNPVDARGGVATFDIRLNLGDAFTSTDLKEVEVGYTIRKYPATWTTAGRNPAEPLVKLTKAEASQPITITVHDFDADAEYYVMAMAVTQGKTDSPQYTEEFKLTYNKPSINTFNVGGTTAAYKGGDVKKIQGMVQFNNANYDGKEWTVAGRQDPVYGPMIRLDLYFTTVFNQTITKDLTATWEPIYSKEIQLNTSARSASIVDTNGNSGFDHTLPVADSTTCAYKLVATDVISGYSVYAFSDTFVIDSHPPTAPQIHSDNPNISDAALLNGTAVTGGEGAKVTIKVGGSTDSASQLAENGYSYKMYYIPTRNGDDLAIAEGIATAGNVTTQKVLQALKAYGEKPLAQQTNANVEFTDWSNLPKQDADNLTSLTVSRDGYYCVVARATDRVGRDSETTTALFRVDLTAPDPPLIRLMQPKAGKTDADVRSNPSASLEAYDGRNYSDAEVWVFLKAVPPTGKTIDLSGYQYSIDGGMTWRDVSKENASTKIATPGTLSIGAYDPLNYAAGLSTDVPYDVAFKIEDAPISGYQTIMAKAKDTLGNTSLPSKTVERRQRQIITATGSLSHSPIEIAMAVGNTKVPYEKISPDLRNVIAQKINAKYFGAVAMDKIDVRDPNTPGYNPLNFLYTKGSDNQWHIHECSWEEGSTECKDASACPYTKYKNENGFEYYTPSMVTLQGVTGSNAGTDKNFKWVKFDHTSFIKYATVVLDSQKNTGDVGAVSSSTNRKIHVNTQGDPAKATYTAKIDNGSGGQTTVTRYTAAQDYVVYGAQELEYDTLADMLAHYRTGYDDDGEPIYNEPGNETQSLPSRFAGYSNMVHRWSTMKSENNDLMYDTPTSAGKYIPYGASGNTSDAAGGCVRRIYHMVDMSVSRTETLKWGSYVSTPQSYTVGNISDSVKDQLVMSTIHAVGYSRGSMRDWIFLYNDQSARKEISFTINDQFVFAHSNEGYGFFFNTTIRQNIAGDWVISGYLFGIGNPTTSSSLSSYKWYILKLTDVNLDWFSAGNLIKEGGYADDSAEDFFIKVVKSSRAGWQSSDGKQKIEVYAYSDPDVTSISVRNFRLVLANRYDEETEKTIPTMSMYLFNTSGMPETVSNPAVDIAKNPTVDALNKHWNEQDNVKTDPNDPACTTYVCNSNTDNTGTNFTSGYRVVHWSYIHADANCSGTNNYVLDVPIATVDGLEIGNLDDIEEGQSIDEIPHSDTNSFGFGPLTAARSYSHGCLRDSLVIFSNISMTVNKARSLSQVVNEPKWGDSKAKFILNISDDSVKDFTDPVLKTAVQNRVINDDARIITLGSVRNKTVTDAFIAQTEKRGVYVQREGQSYASYVSEIADYCTTTYYQAYGLDPKSATSIAAQVNAQAKDNKGTVYTLADAQKMTFRVETYIDPVTGELVDYNTSSANEDFPSGRWFIVHDTTGYTGVQVNPLNNKWSDGLNLKVTAPGRYSVYFAPDKALVPDPSAGFAGKLDPKANYCVFDFIVNQTPKAQFMASLDTDGKTIKITDNSADPDTGTLKPTDTQPTGAKEGGGTVQIAGIEKTAWKWDITAQYVDPVTEETSVVTLIEGVYKGTSKDPYNNKTIEQLTKGTVDGAANVTVYEANITKLVNAGKFSRPGTSGGKSFFDKLPSGAVMTFYESVTDVSMRRVLNSAGTGYVFEDPRSGKNSTSSDCRQNLLTGGTGSRTAAPFSLISLSTTDFYDTADSTSQIIITRSSQQSQNENFQLGWELECSYGTFTLHGDSATGATKGNFNNWYLPNNSGVSGWWTEPVLVKYKVSPSCTNGKAVGDWTISQAFVKWATKNIADGEVTLRCNESLRGVPFTSEDGVTEEDIVGPSARTIYYRRDKNAPSAPIVDVIMQTKNIAGGWSDGEYNASGFLDVSSGDKRIVVKVSGSKENEGKLMGYGYYFYNTQEDGLVDKVWYINNDTSSADLGERTEVTAALISATEPTRPAKGATETDAEYNARADVIAYKTAKNALSKEKIRFAVGVSGVSGNTVNSQNRGYLSVPTGNNTANIYITAKSRITIPTDNLNVAIFAFDNQQNYTATDLQLLPDNVTKANESARSKVEKIKLAAFTPMPPEISGVNALGDQVVHRGNENAFKENADKGLTDRQDVQVRANSNVTFTFTPKQGWYKLDPDENVYKLQATHTDEDKDHVQFYMDVTKYADLTNKAQIDYRIARYNNTSKKYDSWLTEFAGGKYVTIDATTLVTVSESGMFQLSYRTRNGSNAFSEVRTVEFEIDKSAPTLSASNVQLIDEDKNAAYVDNSWAKNVFLRVSGATDDNADTARYYWSLDNGATYHRTRPGLGANTIDGKNTVVDDENSTATEAQKATFAVMNSTGEYNVRVYAEDQAGNRSEIIQKTVFIDTDPPVTSVPEVTPTAGTTMMYSNYIVSAKIIGNGTVKAYQNGGIDPSNENNTDVVVELKGSQTFKITPAAGHVVKSVAAVIAPPAGMVSENPTPVAYTLTKMDGTAVPGVSSITSSAPALITVSNVTENVEITVEFEASGATPSSYMYSGRVATASANAGRAVAYSASGNNGFVSYATYMVRTPDDQDTSHGNITFANASGVSGADVSVEAGSYARVRIKPNSGWTYDQITVTRGGTPDAVTYTPVLTDGAYEFTITDIQTVVLVKVTYKKLTPHTMTLTYTEHGSVKVGNAAAVSGSTHTFYEGDPITLAFVDLDDGYEVKAVRINGTGVSPASGTAFGNEYVITSDKTQTDISVDVEFGPASGVTINTVTVVYDDQRVTVSPAGTNTNTLTGEQDSFGRVVPTDYRNLPIYEVKVRRGGSWTFRITPMAGYTPTAVMNRVEEGEWVEGTPVVLQKQVDGSWTCEVSNINDNSITLYIKVTNNTYKVSYNVTSDSSSGVGDGGTISGTRSDGGSFGNEMTVPEDSNITFHVTPKDGWRIGSIKLEKKNASGGTDTIDIGNRRTFTLENIMAVQTVYVTFVERPFSSVESSHSINVTAVRISDNQQDLDKNETYCFGLIDTVTNAVTWSAWQSSPSYTFNNLQPDRLYKVRVRAQDAVGNKSTEDDNGQNTATVATLCNLPTALTLEPQDEADSLEKSVVMTVDSCGNPDTTKYHVYLSNYASMANSSDATLEGMDDTGFASLNQRGQLVVKNLAAGRRYYMQVVAKNQAGTMTQANSRNIVSIQLSPSSPAENSLYFEEQKVPGGPITLHWTKISGDVENYIIYRDGAMIGMTEPDQTTFTDESPAGDTLHQYSYAVRNSVGTGSRRVAVSEEYYRAAVTKDNPNGASQADLDALKGNAESGSETFNEAMTYPVFPDQISKISAAGSSENNMSGKAEILIYTASGRAARAQKYEVGLQAYDVTIDDVTKEKTRVPTPGWNWEDHVVTTKSPGSTGAIATWEGLDINKEYRVVIKSVMSTGKRVVEGNTIKDGYTGSTAGLEYTLGKVYVTNKQGYGYYYTNSSVGTLLTQNGLTAGECNVTSWADDTARKEYTAYNDITLKDFEVPFGAFIEFNKSPHIKLADNYFSGNTNPTIVKVNGRDTLVLDQSRSMKFNVAVKVWDVDGTPRPGDTYSIKGTLSSLTGEVTTNPDPSLTENDNKNIIKTVKTTEDEALTYLVEFDANRFNATGIYGSTDNKMVLSVSDGGSRPSIEVEVPVLINRTEPAISVEMNTLNGSGIKLIENGRNYGKEEDSAVKITTSVEAANVDPAVMRTIKLQVMGSQIRRMLNVTDDSIELTEAVVMSQVNSNATAQASAAKVLGSTTYDAYMADGSFDATETQDLINKFEPEVTAYFEITEAQYNALKDVADAKVYSRADGFWAEKEYAFQHDAQNNPVGGRLCKFLVRDTNGDITVSVEESGLNQVYSVKLEAAFGGNKTSLPVSFRVVTEPTVTVRSNKVWGWVDVTPDEYRVYKERGYSVQRVVDGAISNLQYEQSEWEKVKDQFGDLTANSWKSTPEGATGVQGETGYKYYVFKLTDKLMASSTNFVSMTVDATTGVYGELSNVKAALFTAANMPMNWSSMTAEQLEARAVDESYGGNSYRNPTLTNRMFAGNNGFKLENLTANTTYYVFICYTVTDPDTKQPVRLAMRNFQTATTNEDYGAAYYGFSPYTASLKERDARSGMQYLNYKVSRNATVTTSRANLLTSIKYFKADENGNLIGKDGTLKSIDADDSELVELTGDELTAARATLYRGPNTDVLEFSAAGREEIQLQLRLVDNDLLQTHMVARIYLTIDEDSRTGYNYLSVPGSYLSVFVQDDEDHITLLKAEVDAEQSSSKLTAMAEIPSRPGTGVFYEYDFADLRQDFTTGDIDTLEIALKNVDGGSALTGIRTEIFSQTTDSSGKPVPAAVASTAFVVSKPPNPNKLDEAANAATGAMRSKLTVTPSTTLKDGVYNAWLKISWDDGQAEDFIWVHLHQVVGQTTLKGYIYITAEKPDANSTTFMGKSEVSVVSTDGTFSRTVKTDNYGYYEIPNILNGKNYYIEVKRPGFLTYNPSDRTSRTTWNVGTDSKEYELSFQLIGGDIDGDHYIRSGTNVAAERDDYKLFAKYFNNAYKLSDESDDTLEFRKRDLNADGVINALDRVIIYDNINKNDSAYGYKTNVPIVVQTFTP